MTGRAPWPVMIVAGVVILAGMATLGALWSGSEAGQAFAQAATSTYESSWLPWAGALVAVGCGIGLLLGWWMARWILLFWMAYGAVESLALLDEPHVNLPVLGAYAPLDVLGLKWAIVAEIKATEAFAPVTAVREKVVVWSTGLVPGPGFDVAGQRYNPILPVELMQIAIE